MEPLEQSLKMVMLKYALGKSVMGIEDIKIKQLMVTNVCNGLPKIHMSIVMVLVNTPMLD